jgi:uncharacterized protein
MSLKGLAWAGGLVGAGMLAYGALVEAKNLKLERHTLELPHWPERLRGFRIAVLADMHIRDSHSLTLAKRAVAMALDESPDMVVLPGDIVAYWRDETAWLVGEALEPLMLMQGACVAIPGNHEYWGGDASLLAPILEELDIKLLRNEHWVHEGITWVGVDSGNKGEANPFLAMSGVEHKPIVTLWHEPDLVDYLPLGSSLMIAGHSHGGQFRFPGGFIPMKTRHGEKYIEGFYADARTPLYVSRGVGTTGPPSRFLCPPEVSLLTLVPG